MELPMELKQAIENIAANYKNSELKKAVQQLIDKYHTKSGQGKSLLSKDVEAIAYALVRLPATYGAVGDALKYALEYFDEDMTTVLDVGAGSGAAAWATVSLLDVKQMVCIEREIVMRKLGQRLMKEGNQVLANSQWLDMDLTKDSLLITADLVVASYVINEMNIKDRKNVIDKLWNSSNKMLLIVEPGTPAGYAVLKEAREYLLSKGAHIIAPCVHENECQLDETDWCHFSCRIQRSKIHKLLKDAEVSYEDEKYSYMAFVKKKCPCASARILRHPYITKGQVLLEVCSKVENKSVVINKKSRDLFKVARKAKQGDSIDIDLK